MIGKRGSCQSQTQNFKCDLRWCSALIITYENRRDSVWKSPINAKKLLSSTPLFHLRLLHNHLTSVQVLPTNKNHQQLISFFFFFFFLKKCSDKHRSLNGKFFWKMMIHLYRISSKRVSVWVHHVSAKLHNFMSSLSIMQVTHLIIKSESHSHPWPYYFSLYNIVSAFICQLFSHKQSVWPAGCTRALPA